MGNSRLEARFEIEKRDLAKILGDSGKEGEIIVEKGTEYAEKLKGLNGIKVSLALVAVPGEKFERLQGYTLLYLKKVKLKISPRSPGQEKPINVSMEGLSAMAHLAEFLEGSRVYGSGAVYVISPPMEMMDFCHSHNAMSPFATPDS